jgi:NADH-quinone oxidoreductase subunit N
MSFVMPDFMLAAPEIFVLGMACLILVVDVFLAERNRAVSYYLSQATLLGAALLTYTQLGGETRLSFGDSFVSDPLSVLLKLSIYAVMLGVFLYSRDYLRDRKLFKGEYYVLGLFAMLGMMVMVSAHSLLTIYLGLELLSLSLYALVAFDRDSARASEAAMKYFVLGALASGMLLYGMSMLYGVSGSLDIATIGAYIRQHAGTDFVLVLGLVFVSVGLAFKLGAVPFHMWLPDVYHGASAPVTLFIGSAPKIAAFAMLLRLLAEALGSLHTEWRDMLIILALLSLAVGNIVAIAQTNIKRMLAYSTISHVGFLLLGVLAGNAAGYAAATFYVVTYAVMALGAFGMIILLSRAGFEAELLEDFKGLNERSPWFAFVMLILMFSMAGVPPTVGFYAKFAVLSAVVDIDMTWLAAAAVVFSIIGAYYYLRIIKLMYFDKPVDETPLTAAFDMRVMLSVNGLAVLALGLFPGALLAWCASALG